MKEFIKPNGAAKVFYIDEGKKRFAGHVLRLHRGKDEYVVLNQRCGETMWFTNWRDVQIYVYREMSWQAFFDYRKKEWHDEQAFSLL